MKVLVLGAGPAGLAAADALVRRGERPLVLERAPWVGGMCRTLDYRGYRLDVGPHRFFTKFDEVQALWEEVLGDELLRLPRLTRIYYQGRYFDYPLKAANALRSLGLREAARCTASYARARLRPRGQERSFEEWVCNRYGDRLFDIFFRSYTEKVWGIPTSEIGADWASQRIKNMELGTLLKRALARPLERFLEPPDPADEVHSLVEHFHYPRLGTGQLYEALAARVREGGGEIRLEQPVVRMERRGSRVLRAFSRRPDGSEEVHEADAFLSSIPLTVLAQLLDPPADVLEAARSLTYRNLVLVYLVVDRPQLFADNWIYVHDPALKVARIQNYKAWSPELVPDPATTSLGLEYFCSDDATWRAPDAELIALGSRELEQAGLLEGGRVLHGTVLRVPRAYPVYRRGYERHLEKVAGFVRGLDNLQPMGRYGMFKYNNSDHSILTALLSVENLFGARHPVWDVNMDSEYHELRRG